MFNFLKKVRKGADDYEFNEGESNYVELDTDKLGLGENTRKILIKPFELTDFADTKPIVDALREGNVIALINIRPLKEKDQMEVKRAVVKIKKTVDAIDGDIAGFGEDYLVATPPFARVERRKKPVQNPEPQDDEFVSL
ncbi:MAG: hypothetical protein PWP03_196 [Candidatus Woesearchaeota archaeon]|nr:hypothetical protein [Candidatus Woesearchaeota archaeon]MDN5327558.1 hypothetical protein [Candidatus Woesearchaeota archaeon]